MITDLDRRFLQVAIDEARRGLAEGGIPIGSALSRGEQLVAAGHNQRVQRGDPMAHAEIACLTNAGRQRTYRDTVLYSTLSPCALCSGAVVQFGIPRVVVGEDQTFRGPVEWLKTNGVVVEVVDSSACKELLQLFIRQQPAIWNEDIGI
jgi:cytosine/creatinine deaminase